MLNLFLEANQIVIAENLYASAFSDNAKSRALIRRQIQLTTSLRSSILSSGRELHNMPFESARLAGTRRADPLEIIQSPISVTKQERRRAYHRKRSACLRFPQFKCGLPAVEA